MTRDMIYAALVSLLLIGVFFAFAIPSFRRSSQLAEVAREWFQSVSAEEFEGAYARMAPSYRASISYDSFRGSVSRSIYLRDYRFFENQKADFQDDRARLFGQLGSQAGEFEAEIHLIRAEEGRSASEDGHSRERVVAGSVWYVAGVTVAGAPVIAMIADE